MTYELSDFRWSALKRYHDRSLELGMNLITYSRFWIHSHDDLHEFQGPRFVVKIMSDMHEFAFNSRKAIEVADSKKSGVIKVAKNVFSNPQEPTIDLGVNGNATITTKSFWWIICRLVHSRETMINFENQLLQTTQTRIYSQNRARVFSFRSDQDGVNAMHNVEIESLVNAYFIVISRAVEGAIKAEAP